ASSGASTSAVSLSWTHAMSTGPGRALVVAIALRGNGDVVTDVKFRGSQLTFLGAQDSGGSVRIELWGLDNPPGGSGTITLTLSGTSLVQAGAISLFGAASPTPIGGFAAAAGSSATPLLAVTSAMNEVVLDALVAEGDALA